MGAVKIKAIETRLLETPFRAVFSHASATRAHAHSVIVNLRDSSGLDGYGEGCPREYVTAERSSTSFEFLNALEPELKRLSSVDDLREFCARKRAMIDRAPAAWCAFELALLDLIGKRNQQTVEQLLNLPKIAPPFIYSAVLGIQAPQAFATSVQYYQKLCMCDFKLKVSGDIAQDCERVGLLLDILARTGGDQVRLRVDANNLWSKQEAVCELVQALPYKPWAIEEPLKDRTDFLSMQQIAHHLGVKIILDESLCSLEALAMLPTNSDCWVANLRISKCGGLLRSIELAQALVSKQVGIIVGAHVGETSILTRAAVSLANAFRSGVLAQEGAFGTYLLAEDIVTPPIMFGHGGLLGSHPSFNAPGLGVL